MAPAPADSEGVIPPFDRTTGNLPPGIHGAMWPEVVERFGTISHRRQLLVGLELALRESQSFGCQRFYLHGSFITNKEQPGDWDGCWEAQGVDIIRLVTEAPILWDDRRGRPDQKARYGGALFPVRASDAESDRTILRDFTTDIVRKRPKGIVRIELETLP
jgi:hypothetical protein